MEIEYPDREAALAAYAEAMEISFERARDALLNEHQLESALARPRNAAVYEDADLPRQAATLFYDPVLARRYQGRGLDQWRFLACGREHIRRRGCRVQGEGIVPGKAKRNAI